MECSVSTENSVKHQCSGVCCVCIRKSVQGGTLPNCLSFFRNGRSWVLMKVGLRRKPGKGRDMAHRRRLLCPQQKANRGMCPCTKDCPYTSPSALCCLCVERYAQKGSKPKCFRVGLGSTGR
jgi:hypothetical protein